MSPFTVRIEPQVLTTFPGFRVHAVVAHKPPSGWPKAPLRPPVTGIDQGVELASHPRIAPWRAAIRAMGLKPSEQRSSVEQLLRRWVQGRFPSTGIQLVDAYNRLSLHWLAPMGAYDREKLGTAVTVRLAHPGADRFTPLGGEAEDFPLKAGVVVYACGDEVICWALNVRDSALTCASEDTSHLVLLSESLDEDGATASRSAVEAFAREVTRSGGQVSPITVAPG